MHVFFRGINYEVKQTVLNANKGISWGVSIENEFGVSFLDFVSALSAPLLIRVHFWGLKMTLRRIL